MSITGTLQLRQAIRFFEQMRDELPRRGVDNVMTLEPVFKQRVIDYAPSRVDALKSSITSSHSRTAQIGGYAGSFSVSTNLPQAFYVEFGTGVWNTFPGASPRMIVHRDGVFRAAIESFFQGPDVNNGPSTGINIPFEPGGTYPRFRTPSTVSPTDSYVYFKAYQGQKPNKFFFRVLEEGHDEPVDKFMEIASRFGFS